MITPANIAVKVVAPSSQGPTGVMRTKKGLIQTAVTVPKVANTASPARVPRMSLWRASARNFSDAIISGSIELNLRKFLTETDVDDP